MPWLSATSFWGQLSLGSFLDQTFSMLRGLDSSPQLVGAYILASTVSCIRFRHFQRSAVVNVRTMPLRQAATTCAVVCPRRVIT